MEPVNEGPARGCHVVAMPHPGRGHINPMMSFCKLLVARRPDIQVTFVVTEEWHGFIGSQPKPPNIRFGCIPNVIPSEIGRAANFPGFVEAVMTKLEAPFEQLLDRLHPPATLILNDTYLFWAVRVGNRRNIPVASFWTQSALVFSTFFHFDLLSQNGHFPVDLPEVGDERVDYLPGISPTRIADLPTILEGDGDWLLPLVLEVMTWVPKSQYVLFTSVYELEARVFDALKPKLRFPIYPIGPIIPHFEPPHNPTNSDSDSDSNSNSTQNEANIFQWLDSQPKDSVLYVSLGSFLSVSDAQLEEIAAGLRDSGVRFLWVARWETSRFKDGCGSMGLVVPWCDQLKVLSHSSIGGFWTHCGWNSTLEGCFAGVPMLTCPIFGDQPPNSKLIVEDWGIGRRVVERVVGKQSFVKKEEIAQLVRGFLDLDSKEGEEMRKRAREVREICRRAIEKDGSSEINIDAFIRDITKT
ncbi:UDP-glycosyltransferase 87A1-like [Malania oleifera]|uniref:UDP-glycosyltransferase 87A1-like n=1 Tax=Malania oleifera TaxID=397392 RepID=UPI0025ADF4A8|nr:UDP-glycosyltransferase 87A1-like [Malania oleifera]